MAQNILNSEETRQLAEFCLPTHEAGSPYPSAALSHR